jgi:hypothetical protein
MLKPHQKLRFLRLLVFQDQACTMRPLFAPLPMRFEQKETKATKSEISLLVVESDPPIGRSSI